MSSPKASNLSRLEKKQEKLKTKCDEYQIKLQTITQEIQSAKRLKKLLKQDQEHLKSSIEKSKNVEKEFEQKLQSRSPIHEPKNERRRSPKNMRANSNPLDYAQFNFGEQKKTEQKKEVKLEEFNEVQDKDVSLILHSPTPEDIIDDSLMDIFDDEVNSD